MNTICQDATVREVKSSSFGGFHRIEFMAMGTCNEVLFAASSVSMAAAFRANLIEWMESFERRISRFRPDSLVSAINREAGGGWVAVDRETEEILSLCDCFHWRTKGIFDPSLLPLLQLWDYHVQHPTLPASVEVARVRSLVGWSRIREGTRSHTAAGSGNGS